MVVWNIHFPSPPPFSLFFSSNARVKRFESLLNSQRAEINEFDRLKNRKKKF